MIESTFISTIYNCWFNSIDIVINKLNIKITLLNYHVNNYLDV